MVDKRGGRRGEHDLAATGPDQVRNVVLVGPSHSGKTSLVEALLLHTGAINRAGTTADGTTVCDSEDAERSHGRSISLAVAPLVHRKVKVNLIDTPGYADFVGDLRAGLRAADCALFVVAANEEVDEGTRALWRECDQVAMPRAVVVTKLDHPRADVDAVVAQAREAFGGKVLPVYLAGADGLTGLLSGGTDDPRRGELIEAIIEESEDEDLMDRYVGGEEVALDVLVADLETAVARASLHPVVPVCATTAVGLGELLDLCVDGFPSPLEHSSPEVFTPAGASVGRVSCDPTGPLVAEVVKTAGDPYVGRISLVRVFSGTLEPDTAVHVSGHFSSFFAAARVLAGDLATVARLSRAETGDTLSAVDEPLVLKPWSMPDPLLPVAIEAATRSDEDKLSQALGRLAAEDPSLRIDNNADTGQLVLWVMGESHADVVLERLAARHGVAVEQRELLVPLRECVTSPAKGHGRHVKQSGGHGQYAICDIEIEPLPEGSGFEFVDKVVGGAVPRSYIPSVEKGVRAQMERGLRHGYPVVDLRVTLTDGKAHSVDSSDMAFQSAGALALREAAQASGVSMLEPYDDVSVLVPDDLVGPVMSDLSARRARLLGNENVDGGRTLVRAHVPQRELVRYAVDLRASTRGAGTFTRAFAHYEPMPEEQARQVTPRLHH